MTSFGAVLLMGGVLLIASSGDGTTTDPPMDSNAVASVSVSGSDDEVKIAGTLALIAQARNAAAGSVTTSFSWSSSDAMVATVDANGVVTGVARGTATITATASGTNVGGSLSLPVRIASIAVTQSVDTLVSIGETAIISAVAQDAAGGAVAGVPFAFTSSELSVATVDAGGNVVAVGNGDVTVTAAADGESGSTDLVVAQVVASAGISPASVSIFTTQTFQFAGGALDANGNLVPGVPATWGSTDPGVATVDSTGHATGVSGGSTTITVAVGTLADSAQLSVATASLANDVQPILSANCALSGCHLGGAPPQGLNLEQDSTFVNTVNVPAGELPSMMRIRPFQPDSSYLVHKIQGTQTTVGGSGAQMPFGATPLSQQQIDIIRAWVTAGATDN